MIKKKRKQKTNLEEHVPDCGETIRFAFGKLEWNNKWSG